MDTKRAIRHLNGLIETCRDGHDGYQSAAHGLGNRNPELKRMFGRFAFQRRDFENRLRLAVSRLGATPREHGTVRGALHRAWMDLNLVPGESSLHDVLKQVERGENVTVAAYGKLAAEELDPWLRNLVEEQLAAVVEVRDTIAGLHATVR